MASAQESYIGRIRVSDRVHADTDGKKALIRLAAGDMRKALNILQVQQRSLCRNGSMVLG